MLMRKFAVTLMAGSSIVAMMAAADTAYAQATDQDDDEVGIEEIIVQARRRGENLQDTPMTVTAFTAQDIDNIGVRSMRDYAKLVPNLFLIETQNSRFTFVNIRGITQMRNLDPSVAVVIDGVLSTAPVTLSQELFDIEQIEVLKGPQGALYGRNAMGGAINIRTKRPDNEFEAMFRMGIGNGDTQKGQAMISGPLIDDKLFIRGAFSYYNSAGVRPNITRRKASDANENTSARVRLIYRPTENFEADFRISMSDDNSTALQFTDVGPVLLSDPSNPGRSLGSGTLTNPVTGGPFFGCAIPTPGGLIPNGSCGFIAGGPVVGGDASLRNPANFETRTFPGIIGLVGNVNNTSVPIQDNLLGIDRRRIYNVSLRMDWEQDNGTLTSITSWDKAWDAARGGQPPRTAARGQINSQWREIKTISQEVRFTTPDDRPLRTIVGAYFVATDAFLSTTVQRDTRGIDIMDTFVRRDPTTAGLCLGPIGAEFAQVLPGGIVNPFFDAALLAAQPTDCVRSFDGDGSDNTAFALFAQFNYDVSDTIEFEASIRWDKDKRTQKVLTPNNFLAAFPTALTFGSKQKLNFDSFQPKATLRYTPNDSVMAYTSYAEGFRSGGFNRPGVGDLAILVKQGPLGPLVPDGVENFFPQQDTRSFEVGVKTNMFGGRFLLNAAGFYTKVDNYQTFTFNPFLNASQIIIPVDEVTIKGLELDAVAMLSENWKINVGFGMTDSEITKDFSRPGNVGNRAPQTPKTTLNVGVEYTSQMSFGPLETDVFIRADYQRIGKLFFMPGNFSRRDPLNLLNFRGGITFEDDWQLAAWVSNATNENFFAEGFNTNGLFFPGKLRMWGFEVTKRF